MLLEGKPSINCSCQVSFPCGAVAWERPGITLTCFRPYNQTAEHGHSARQRQPRRKIQGSSFFSETFGADLFQNSEEFGFLTSNAVPRARAMRCYERGLVLPLTHRVYLSWEPQLGRSLVNSLLAVQVESGSEQVLLPGELDKKPNPPTHKFVFSVWGFGERQEEKLQNPAGVRLLAHFMSMNMQVLIGGRAGRGGDKNH